MKSATLNVRMSEELKRAGDTVLQRNGVSITDVVRRLYEVIVETQEIPEDLLDQAQNDSVRAEIERKRAVIRAWQGILPSEIDRREAELDGIKREIDRG